MCCSLKFSVNIDLFDVWSAELVWSCTDFIRFGWVLVKFVISTECYQILIFLLSKSALVWYLPVGRSALLVYLLYDGY
jgi:hypothetical protein